MGRVVYIDVIFPLALPYILTYKVPELLQQQVQLGSLVEAELRNKIYSGIVVKSSSHFLGEGQPKFILSVLSDKPITTTWQLDMWQWMADYYCCTPGEVMDAALPIGMKLKSEAVYRPLANLEMEEAILSNEEFRLWEAMSHRKEMTLKEIQIVIGKKSVLPIIRSMIYKQTIEVKEEVEVRYKTKKVKVVRLHPSVQNESDLDEASYKIKSEAQIQMLHTIYELSIKHAPQNEFHLKELGDPPSHILTALQKKGLIIVAQKDVSRLKHKAEQSLLPDLGEEQKRALEIIHEKFNEKKPVLIHGVTGSGKTRIYQELIRKVLAENGQVLYLLPEISLSGQMVQRMADVFGSKVRVYNSRVNPMERYEIWNDALTTSGLYITARSGVFLPLQNLQLIIVDEEHDPSFKQSAPAPNYNARDIALYIANQVKCPIILGSATPSLESYYNAMTEKFALIQMHNRFGNAVLPKIEVVNLVYERKTGRYKDILSVPLIKKMKDAFDQKKQVILFQNRRGYVPVMQCKQCGWITVCDHCDVSLTYHRYTNELRCHYCNARKQVQRQCPSCQGTDISELGLGTEKVEEKVQAVFPDISVSRFDFDTTRTKNAQDKILTAFENGDVQVLVGTQMVTKGFDFDHVTVVGIINADALMSQPDFRANERAFQLMTQVAGRAGRRDDQGTVVIQTYMAKHPVIKEVINHDFKGFFQREIFERKQFSFPPFVRIIHIEILHKDPMILSKAADFIATSIQNEINDRCSNPIQPAIPRIKNFYIRQLVIKLEKKQTIIVHTKLLLKKIKEEISTNKSFGPIKIKIDVDPY